MKCSVETCQNEAACKGLCGKHYKRQWRHGDANKTMIIMNEGKACVVEDCERPAAKLGVCKMHYTRFWRYGRLENIIADKGKGRPMTSAGYILLTVDGKRKYEHIHLAEKALGKLLPEGAVVHHMNNTPWDNHTPFNLVVCSDQAYHMLLHKRARDLGYA